MKSEDGIRMAVFVEFPEYDPIGMGYTGILMSDMFGFRSDFGLLTLSYLDDIANLASFEKLSPEQFGRLEELNQELAKSGFLEAYSDPYFASFVTN